MERRTGVAGVVGVVVLLLAMAGDRTATAQGTAGLRTEGNLFTWQSLPELPEVLGVGGPFVGVNGDRLIVAGGCNSPVSIGKIGKKVYRNEIYVLEKTPRSNYRWRRGFELPRAIAHGAAVTTDQGVVCLGGRNTQGSCADVFLLRWNAETESVDVTSMPALPRACHYLAAARIGKTIYVASGIGEQEPLKNFWALDLAAQGGHGGEPKWRTLPAWPGPARFGSVLVGQTDGEYDCLYMFSGKGGKHGKTCLVDAYRYNPRQADENKRWTAIAPMPRAAFSAPAAAVGQSHVLIFSGTDGSDGHNADRPRESRGQSNFVRDVLAYHTITNTWTTLGKLPQRVTDTAAVCWDNGYVIPCGEIRPGVTTPKVYLATATRVQSHFGLLDYAALGGYMALLVAVGWYFSQKEKTSGDFFLGGQRIPWWAAGLSLLATHVSSVGFMAVPAKSYATNWLYFAGVATWFIVVPIVTWAFIPVYRRLDVTSAYEYLEARFNLAARLFGTIIYSLMQLARMTIVLYLPALALSAVTGINPYCCVLIMGVLCTLYTVAGGIEAVIWTDVIQAVLLMGGALLCVAMVLFGIEGGAGRFFDIAFSDGKFRMADLNWDATKAVLWVVLLGNVFTRFSTLTSDQSIVQRYMSTPSEKQARRALWTDVAVSVPWAIIVFMLGTALYVFYKTHPELLNPTLDTDGIVPLFIAQQLPTGLSGLVIAAVFAAAMSSLDSSIHSVATIWVTDFFARFKPRSADRTRLRLARWLTALLGVLGTASALLMVSADIKSLWDFFQKTMGLFLGALAGLFILGIFTRRTNAAGAQIGALFSVVALFVIERNTRLHFFLYPVIGMVLCVGLGYLASMVTRGKPRNLQGLTVYTPHSST